MKSSDFDHVHAWEEQTQHIQAHTEKKWSLISEILQQPYMTKI